MIDVKFNEAMKPLVQAMESKICDTSAPGPVSNMSRNAAAAVVEALGIPAQMVASPEFRRDLSLLVESHKSADGQNPPSFARARDALERVFYWLGMGDEGPEASLPLPSEVSEDKGVSELLEEVRIAALGLGGLQEEGEDEGGGPIPDPPACGAPIDNAT